MKLLVVILFQLENAVRLANKCRDMEERDRWVHRMPNVPKFGIHQKTVVNGDVGVDVFYNGSARQPCMKHNPHFGTGNR